MGKGPGLTALRRTFDPCDVHSVHVPKVDLRDIAINSEIRLDSEVISICPAGMARIEAALGLIEAHEGNPPWSLMQHFGEKERRIAEKVWWRR